MQTHDATGTEYRRPSTIAEKCRKETRGCNAGNKYPDQHDTQNAMPRKSTRKLADPRTKKKKNTCLQCSRAATCGTNRRTPCTLLPPAHCYLDHQGRENPKSAPPPPPLLCNPTPATPVGVQKKKALLSCGNLLILLIRPRTHTWRVRCVFSNGRDSSYTHRLTTNPTTVTATTRTIHHTLSRHTTSIRSS